MYCYLAIKRKLFKTQDEQGRAASRSVHPHSLSGSWDGRNDIIEVHIYTGSVLVLNIYLSDVKL